MRASRFPGSDARKLPGSTNNLLGWVLPPLVICAVEAHRIIPYIDHNHVHRTAMRYDTRDARPVRFKEDKDANAPMGCSDLIGARRIARPEWPNRALIHAIYGL